MPAVPGPGARTADHHDRPRNSVITVVVSARPPLPLTPMPLSPPAPRTDLHRRRMDFRGYRRDDGLFDIECTLLDTKGMDVPLLGVSRVVKAGEPMHDMAIRMCVNDDLEVVDIEASSDATPYTIC